MRFMFSDEKVEEFRKFYEYHYEQPCTTDEAHHMCLILLELYDCLKDVELDVEDQESTPE
jgi:hypothetical protein